MKKLLLFICIATCMSIHGKPISQKEAFKVAVTFFSTFSDKEIKPVLKKDVNNPYYIFTGTDGKGFVIVSKDDCAQQIIGYSKEADLVNGTLPPQLEDLLNRYYQKMATLSPNAPLHKSWSVKHQPSTSNAGILLNTASWGQSYPYNTNCPTIDGVQCPTGCVATAMAILMKYHNWPKQYDWEQMPLDNITEENEYISSLMADIGKAVSMEYTPVESGAYFGLVSQSLFADFGYSYTAQMVTLGEGNHVHYDEWQKIMYEEINNGRPIAYMGSGTANHAFIIDGYDNNNMFHVNWGWNGSYNGYFALSELAPYEDANFSWNQGMVLSVNPPTEDESKYSKTAYIDYGYLVGLECMHGFGLNSESASITKDQPFHITYATLNVRPQTWFGVALTDQDGNIKEMLYSEYCSSEQADDQSNFIHYLGENQVTITVDIDDTDKLYLVAKESEDAPWQLVRGTIETPSFQSVNEMQSLVTKLNWIVPEDIEVKLGGSLKMVNGTISAIAKGTLLEVSAYAEEPGMVTIAFDDMTVTIDRSNDISLWEYGKIGAVGSRFCIDDEINVHIDFIPESEYKEAKINLTEAGTLGEALSSYDLRTLKTLTITGNIDKRDFDFITGNLPTLVNLDISNATIHTYEKYAINHIPEGALAGMRRLKTLNLPNNLEVIESFSMDQLYNLHDIEIPKTVTEIKDDAFRNCPHLYRIKFNNPQPFNGTAMSLPESFSYYGFIVVPEGSVEKYKTTPYSNNLNRILEGDLVPATSVKLVDFGTESDIDTLFLRYLYGDSFKFIFEPENSTDYILGGAEEVSDPFIAIYYDAGYPVCSVPNRVLTEQTSKVIFETSSGVKVEYPIVGIPPIQTLQFRQNEVYMKKNDALQLEYDFYPASYPIRFESSDPNIVSIQYPDMILALANGEADITAIAQDALGERTAVCHVIVSETSKETVNVDISSVGYNTLYYSTTALEVPVGVKAYTYKQTDNGIAVENIYEAGHVIPAGEAVVLQGTPNMQYTFKSVTTNNVASETNALHGSDVEAMTEGKGKHYALSLNAAGDPTSVGFYYIEENGAPFLIPEHRAYLVLNDANGVKSFYTFAEVETTDIKSLVDSTTSAGTIYNLQGQRVNIPIRGIYIVNGRKIFIQ